MKKKLLIGAAATLLMGLSLYAYHLTSYQSMEETKNRVAYVEPEKSSASQSSQTEELTPDEISAKEKIDAEQIVVSINDQGYVTSHGDHYHYYSGSLPYDSIFSEELLMDSDYVLNEEHIVQEVKDGCIIKVNTNYYLYLNDPSHRDTVRTKQEIEDQKNKG